MGALGADHPLGRKEFVLSPQSTMADNFEPPFDSDH